MCYPNLIFGLIGSQVNVLQDDDVFELDSPFIVITDKLKNIVYLVNDISDPVMIDATVTTPVPVCPIRASTVDT